MLDLLGATSTKPAPAAAAPWYERKWGPMTVPAYAVGVGLLGVVGLAVRKYVAKRVV